MRTRIGKWKLKTQILVSMVIMTIFATCSLGVSTWMVSKKIIEENYTKTYESNLRSFNSAIDSKLEAVTELIRSEVLSDDICNILREDNSTGSTYFPTSASWTLNRMAISLESQSNLIDAVFLFDDQGRYQQHFRGEKDSSKYQKFYGSADITHEAWYRKAAEQKGKECFFGYNVLIPEDTKGKVSLVKQIRSPVDREVLGMLVVRLTNSFLRSSLVGNSREFASDTLLIIDENYPERVVYNTGSEQENEDMIRYYLENGPENNSAYLFTTGTNLTTGWKVVNGIARSDLSKDSVYVGTTVTVAAVFILLICILLSSMLSKRINQPLHKLEKVLEEVKQGSRNITEEFDDGEIGSIGNTLKETVNHNIELKERVLELNLKERESELLLLQAQINPHFLYNTLDSIYCQAKLKDENGIAEMVNDLSETFKISLNKGQQKITIAEEVEYIQRYMKIQDVRYQGRFELIMEIEEEIMSLHIIKLILQPFVENAMYHGLEPKIGSGFVEIKGERMEDDLYFSVSDNGVGMKTLDEIYAGYGIRNVVDRIHLFYGEEYGIEVTSEFGAGTRVDIHIPVMKEERDSYDNVGDH
ncbi:MAG: sensor histidine kinase [Eubacteriales bacterium]|nr:sensor histidine kinase [Eubacteriales bacterium]